MDDNRPPRGKATKVASEAMGRRAVPSEGGSARTRSKATKLASETLGRAALPPEANRQGRGGQARAGQVGNVKGNPAVAAKSGGKRKALEAASAADKRSDRQGKPKGKA
jgi:hypothetical protein